MNNTSTPAGEGNHQKLLTIKEVAAYLRVSRVTAWRWCQCGLIPAFRIGRSWRVHQADLIGQLDLFKAEQAQLSVSENSTKITPP